MGDTDTGVDENDPGNYFLVSDIKKLMENEGLKEIGVHAVWSVSSCKQGYGVNLLRDNNLETYWQSDGSQPHMVNIQFRQKTTLHCIGIYMDHKTDESYTPNKLSVRVGNDFNDLNEIETLEINEPSGWVLIKLNNSVHGKATRTFMTQIAVLQNHQNGRDTHLRQIKIFASSKDGASMDNVISGRRLPQFSSVDVAMYSIR